jgi:hypothetical protein
MSMTYRENESSSRNSCSELRVIFSSHPLHAAAGDFNAAEIKQSAIR